jgi:hypothetical protein
MEDLARSTAGSVREVDPNLSELIFSALGVSLLFGTPWSAWFISSRRKHKREMASLEVAREQEVTKRRQLELEYELKQRELTERLFTDAAREYDEILPAPRPRRTIAAQPSKLEQAPAPGPEPSTPA